jgi:hypothetical protein
MSLEEAMRAAMSKAKRPQIGLAKKMTMAKPNAVAVCPEGKLFHGAYPTVHSPL